MKETIKIFFFIPIFLLAVVAAAAIWLQPSLMNGILFVFFSILLIVAAWYGGHTFGQKTKNTRTLHLLEAKEKFQKIFDSNMIGMVFSDNHGRILEANDYFLNLIQYTRRELAEGKIEWRDITSPESMAQSLENFEQVRKGRRLPPFEKEYVLRDGTRVPVSISTASMNDSLDRIVVFVQDISERKKAEQKITQTQIEMEGQINRRTQEIRESRHFLDSVIENIPNMIFVKDAQDLRFIRFNRAGEDLLGYPREQLLGRNDYDFFPRDQADHFIKADKSVLSSNKVVDVAEEPIQTRTGMRLLHTKKIPLFDKDGKPQYLLGISEDITEKKAAENQRYHLLQEQAAREEAERSAQQLAFLAEATKELGKSLNYRETLQAFTQVVTRSLGDFCSVHAQDENGSRVLALYHRDPKSLQKIEAFRHIYPVNWVSREGLKKVIETGDYELYQNFTEHVLNLPELTDQEKALMTSLDFRAMMVLPLKFYGKILGAMVIATNQDRQYSPFDLSLAQELSKRVSLALENAQLYEKAQEANRAKTSFLANMSHEIRTPLGAMIGFAELVLESPNLDNENIQSLETILRNGRQLLRIVDEILDISKVESDRLSIENIKFPLLQVVDDVISLLSGQALEKGLKFTFSAASSLPEWVVSDPTRLRQVLINIIGNAIKFTEVGGIEVILRANPLENLRSRCKLTFSIQDTGVGISPEQERHLFQPFAQGDSSTTRKFGGTGLGLFLSRKLAHALAGNLVLESSQLNQGSTFVFTLEVDTAEESSDTIKTVEKDNPHLNRKNDKPHLSSLNVLVVEDAPDNRALIGRYIELMGFHCDFAEDGFEGVEKALNGKFDLVLMDIQMPGMDGFEALKKLQSHQFKTPVIALTAHAMKGDRERCLESGFDGYLMKPIHRNQLQDVLLQYSQEKT